jgi:hypothetical protein
MGFGGGALARKKAKLDVCGLNTLAQATGLEKGLRTILKNDWHCESCIGRNLPTKKGK